MKKVTLLAILAVVCLGLSSHAQEVGDNINVLPVFKTADDFIDELDYVRGDLYGNRQGEPAIAASSLNPDHLLAVYNDFRLVDVPDDPPLPGLLARVFGEKLYQLASFLGLPTPAPRQPTRLARNLEAGIGMSVSYDRGITWVGGFVPGQFPGDETPASQESPGLGTDGASDPVLLAAPCGRFYLVWLQFIRGDISRLMAALIQDHNDSDLEHTFTWEYATLIREKLNATNGPFQDKPEASLTLTGESNCSDITEELNVTWTEFTGKGNFSNFQSKLFFGKSVDQAKSFDIIKVDDKWTDTTGTATVVDPVTNDIFVFFRSFNPPTMVMTKSTTNGRRWSKPVDLLEASPLVPFDNPTVGILDIPIGSTSIRDQLSPRANGFPTAAFTPDGGTLMLAWHERVRVDWVTGVPVPVPDPDQGPKVVAIFSQDGGGTWSDRQLIAPTRRPSPAGLGLLQLSGSGLLPGWPTSRSTDPASPELWPWRTQPVPGDLLRVATP